MIESSEVMGVRLTRENQIKLIRADKIRRGIYERQTTLETFLH